MLGDYGQVALRGEKKRMAYTQSLPCPASSISILTTSQEITTIMSAEQNVTGSRVNYFVSICLKDWIQKAAQCFYLYVIYLTGQLMKFTDRPHLQSSHFSHFLNPCEFQERGSIFDELEHNLAVAKATATMGSRMEVVLADWMGWSYLSFVCTIPSLLSSFLSPQCSKKLELQRCTSLGPQPEKGLLRGISLNCLCKNLVATHTFGGSVRINHTSEGPGARIPRNLLFVFPFSHSP